MVWWHIIAIVLGSIAGGVVVGILALRFTRRNRKATEPFRQNHNGVIVNQAPKPAISTAQNNTFRPPKERRESGVSAVKVRPTPSTEDSLREALNKLKSARMAEWATIKKPDVEQPVVNKADIEQPVAKKADIEQPVAKKADIEQPVVNKADIEQPVVNKADIEQPVAIKTEALLEAEANLKTATAPWADKLLPFQTTAWNSSQSEFNDVPAQLQEELTRVYADMRLANDIVWLATVVGRQSEELNSSYRGLCAKVAERLVNIIPKLNNSGGTAK